MAGGHRRSHPLVIVGLPPSLADDGHVVPIRAVIVEHAVPVGGVVGPAEDILLLDGQMHEEAKNLKAREGVPTKQQGGTGRGGSGRRGKEDGS